MQFYGIYVLGFVAIGNLAICFNNIPGCGETKVDLGDKAGKIIGGRYAYQGEEPWAVRIGTLMEVKNVSFVVSFCGGTLITSRHVLTAAHCIRNSSERYIIRVGDLFLNEKPSKGAIDIRVEKVIRHEKFDILGKNRKLLGMYDIAMVYLVKDVVFTDLIIPICLPEKHDFNNDNLGGQTAIIAGWGRNGTEGDYVTTKILKVANVTIFTNEVCKKRYKIRNISIVNSQICAGTKVGGVGSCHGDSGSPLITKQGKKHFITGITSLGLICASNKLPTVYTRVSSFLDWIDQHITK